MTKISKLLTATDAPPNSVKPTKKNGGKRSDGLAAIKSIDYYKRKETSEPITELTKSPD
jgi:hypothetical protein